MSRISAMFSHTMDGGDIPAHPLLRREWIKFQLRLRGITLSAIARELGVSRQALGQTLVSAYPRMERAIAAKLEMEPRDIWPERYARRHVKAAGSKRPLSCHVKKVKHNTAAWAATGAEGHMAGTSVRQADKTIHGRRL